MTEVNASRDASSKHKNFVLYVKECLNLIDFSPFGFNMKNEYELKNFNLAFLITKFKFMFLKNIEIFSQVFVKITHSHTPDHN